MNYDFNNYILIRWFFKLFYSRLFAFPSGSGNCGARFNGSGSQLLLSSGKYPQLVVCVFPTAHRHQLFSTGKVALKDLEFNNELVCYDAFCFAGIDDQLVISGSISNNLYNWSLPDAKRQDCTINRSLQSNVAMKTQSTSSALALTNPLSFRVVMTVMTQLSNFGTMCPLSQIKSK